MWGGLDSGSMSQHVLIIHLCCGNRCTYTEIEGVVPISKGLANDGKISPAGQSGSDNCGLHKSLASIK